MNFRGDSRSQAIQVGAVLIFGLLIVLFSTYQAFVVPNQNEQIDFNHHQEVERDMVELRSNVLQAKTTGEDRFSTVKLGTEYPSRIIARNPPDPSGTLRTTENRTIEVDTDDDGTDDLPSLFTKFEPENKFIEFQPNYAEFREASLIRYENTVVYKDLGDRNLALSNQRLVNDDTISLIPLHRDYQASGGQAAAIEPVPGILERKEVDDPTVTLGTELGEDDWLELFDEEIQNNDNLDEEDISVVGGDLTLDLTGTFTIEYAPVGLDRSPFGGERGDGSLGINPAAPGDIRLVDESRGSPSSGVVTLEFDNTADLNNFTEARIAFYSSAESSQNQRPVEADLTEGQTTGGTATTIVFREALKSLNEKVQLQKNSPNYITLKFLKSNGGEANLDEESWFVLELVLESGQKATYFVPVPPGN